MACVCFVFIFHTFFARIPYYQIFNNAFDMMVINGMHDDMYAILMTAINEYQMIWRLAASIVVGVILAKILYFVLKIPVVQFKSIEAKRLTVIFTVFLYLCFGCLLGMVVLLQVVDL